MRNQINGQFKQEGIWKGIDGGNIMERIRGRRKNKGERGKVTGGDFFWLGVDAFGGLGMEMIYAYLLEPAVYGAPMGEWTTVQTIMHWIVTCATWGIFAAVLIKKAQEKYQFPVLEKGSPVSRRQWGICLLLVALSFVADYISWGGFKIYLEFVRRGPLLFTFQYIYYAFETMLFLLIIVFGQKACEVWFNKAAIPYGGIICGLTWGLAHIFSKDLLTGLMGIALGFGMGGVYLLVNRDLKKAYVILFLMFIL